MKQEMNRDQIFDYTLRTLLQPIWGHLEDDTVSEVLINGPGEVYIESKGKLTLTESKFPNHERLEAACRNIAQFSGTELGSDRLRIDARLPNGSRVHMIFPPLTAKGICIAIRKFTKGGYTLDALTEMGALSADAVSYLKWCVLTNRNLMIAGGTSSGKTTLLNSLSAIIPNDQRILTIEDTFELQLSQPHVVAMETRTDVDDDQKPVTMRELFHSSLRLRPDRIIMGELRGGEALDYLQAMISGHGGSLSTIHADTPLDSLHRLETLAMMSQIELPLFAIRAQVRSAIHVIVQMSKGYSGKRVVSAISEVIRTAKDSSQYDLNAIFQLKPLSAKSLKTELAMSGNKSVLLAHTGETPIEVDLSSIADILPHA